MPWTRTAILTTALAAVAVTAPSQARPGGWGAWGGGWGGGLEIGSSGYYGSYRGRDPREGKVEAATFVANSPNIGALGHGPIALAPAAGGEPSALEASTFESAIVGQLAGYQTDAVSHGGGQLVEYVVSHDVIQPPEGRRDPVSGGVSIGAGNRGSAVGLGLGIDLSRPARALVATRLQARIRDAATHELLWEGRAQVITRDGDKHWSGPELAARLTAAQFKGFPKPS